MRGFSRVEFPWDENSLLNAPPVIGPPPPITDEMVIEMDQSQELKKHPLVLMGMLQAVSIGKSSHNFAHAFLHLAMTSASQPSPALIMSPW